MMSICPPTESSSLAVGTAVSDDFLVAVLEPGKLVVPRLAILPEPARSERAHQVRVGHPDRREELAVDREPLARGCLATLEQCIGVRHVLVQKCRQCQPVQRGVWIEALALQFE